MSRKHLGLGAFGGGVVALCAASVAWACTFQPHIFGLTAESGPPQSQVTVTGNTAAQGGPVQIRWNSATGALLGQGATDGSGNFSVTVTIPDATPDVYSIMAVSNGVGVARSAFEVTSVAPAGSTAVTSSPTAGSADAWTSGFAASRPGASRGLSVVDTGDQGVPAAVPVAGGLLVAAGIGVLAVAALRRRREAAIL